MAPVLKEKRVAPDLSLFHLPRMPMETTVLREEDQARLESPFCGKLRKVLPPDLLQNVDGVVAFALQTTKAHFHQQFAECYMVLSGSLDIALYNRQTSEMTSHTLKGGDVMLIAPGTGHKVLGGSNDNMVMVLCSPPFRAEDETACPELEAAATTPAS